MRREKSVASCAKLDFTVTEENIKKILRQKLSQAWMEPLWENGEFCGKYKKE